jgi:quinoprotein glucose dehydrogenase
VRCHKVGSKGGEVGPNLTGIAKEKDRRYLLESILMPDATLAKNFETAIVLTEDGEIFIGIVKSENDEGIELVLADGKSVKLAKTEISERRKGKSSMPLDLYKYLSDRELRDLVAFLASLDGNQKAEKSETGHGL